MFQGSNIREICVGKTYKQGCESSDISLISGSFFALHKTPFSDFQCIEKHIFSGISDYFRLFLTDALTPLIIGYHVGHFQVELST